MSATSPRRGFTIGELVVIILVLVLGLAVVVPLVQRSRREARRSSCLNNLKTLGLGLLGMESALKRFPPSCRVKKDADGKIISLDGWSWCEDILPFMYNKPGGHRLDTVSGLPLQPNADGSTSHEEALAAVIREFHCPSFKGNAWVDRNTEAEAITNYKALGATHVESLNVASPNPTVPKYAPDSDRHPDGAMFPGSTIGLQDIKGDGTSLTVLVVETVEQNVARWTVGNECAVVGLPPVVSFEQKYGYYHPTGYTANRFWDESTIPAKINRTYLNWDYDKHPYDDGGVSTPSAAATGPIKYGPSSHHPGVVNHLFANGDACSISNQVDAALYMFIISRQGQDPVPHFTPE